MHWLTRAAVITGFVIGDICLILAVVADFSGGMLATIKPAGFVRLAATIIFATITLVIIGYRKLAIERPERVEIIHFREGTGESPREKPGKSPEQSPDQE